MFTKQARGFPLALVGERGFALKVNGLSRANQKLILFTPAALFAFFHRELRGLLSPLTSSTVAERIVIRPSPIGWPQTGCRWGRPKAGVSREGVLSLSRWALERLVGAAHNESAGHIPEGTRNGQADNWRPFSRFAASQAAFQSGPAQRGGAPFGSAKGSRLLDELNSSTCSGWNYQKRGGGGEQQEGAENNCPSGAITCYLLSTPKHQHQHHFSAILSCSFSLSLLIKWPMEGRSS